MGISRGALAVVLGLLSTSAGLAQDDGKYLFTIYSYPPGAGIYISDLEYLGLTGEPVRLRNQSYKLTLRLAAHKKTQINVDGENIKVDGRYPRSGAVVLEPDNFSQYLLDTLKYRRGFVAGALLVTVAGGAAAVGHARRSRTIRKREDDLRILTMSLPDGQSSEQRSLILQQVGGYRVLSLLGRGGMAEVYTAVPSDSLELKNAVAIKVMNRELRDDPHEMERFRRETTLCGELVHPGIVELIASGEQDGRFYMVMELVEGQELRKLLPELKGNWKRIGGILSQLFQAVDYAHTRGIAHRDLKPENVMITSQERVKVMDFGLGRAVDSKTLTQVGATLGTPRYIAPEAVSGAYADDRADQYSLGVMAFEMIVGRLPFDGDDILYLLYSHANLAPPSPSELANLPKAIDEVLLKMLSKDPRHRFRSVEEARVELLAAMETLA